jgi:hypothetical protein
MKKQPSVFLIGVVSVATAAYFGLPWGATTAAGQTPAANVSPPASAPAATPTVNMPAPGMAFGVSEVLKMYQGGINKEVILHYIQNTILPFHMTADNIIHLQSLGMPEEIIKTLIQRDGQLQQQAMTAYRQQPPNGYGQQPPPGYGQQPPPGYGQPPPMQSDAVVMPTSPPPPVAYPVDYSAYPYDYGYAYPYYGYYGYPYLGFGWGGWGWGGRYGGFRGGVGGFRGGVGGFRGGFGGGGFRAGVGGGGHGGGGGHR